MRLPQDPAVRRCRLLVLMVAVIALAGKLVLAATTYGTNDIGHWLEFLHGVRDAGPVGVYSFHFAFSLYNHPPLIGYYLEGVSWLTHLGLTPQFTIRAVSSLADVAATAIVFSLLLKRRGLPEATFGALVVAVSPILVIISGFHGNTDPVFAMLALLSAYLLADRDRPLLAGAALALAVGVKIVPIVVAPCLLVYAFRRGPRVLVRFAASAVVVSLVFWLPAMLRQWTMLRRNVIGYTGSRDHEWGIEWLAGHYSSHLADELAGSGRLVIVGACALVPAVLVLRRPNRVVEATALSLAAFLLLTPAFGTQYLAWAAAGSLLLSIRFGAVYNLIAGALLFVVYNRWNGGLPWYHAHASPFTTAEEPLAFVAWLSLAVCVGIGVWHILRSERPAAPGTLAHQGGDTSVRTQ